MRVKIFNTHDLQLSQVYHECTVFITSFYCIRDSLKFSIRLKLMLFHDVVNGGKFGSLEDTALMSSHNHSL